MKEKTGRDAGVKQNPDCQVVSLRLGRWYKLVCLLFAGLLVGGLALIFLSGCPMNLAVFLFCSLMLFGILYLANLYQKLFEISSDSIRVRMMIGWKERRPKTVTIKRESGKTVIKYAEESGKQGAIIIPPEFDPTQTLMSRLAQIWPESEEENTGASCKNAW